MSENMLFRFWQKFQASFALEDVARRLSEMVEAAVMGLMVFLLFVLVARISTVVLQRFIPLAGTDRRQVLLLLVKTARVTLYILGGISALGTMGVNVSALVASLGLTGFALGFALKDAISNLLAGVLILLYRPFRQGETIAINGVEGIVTNIDLRFTTLASEGQQFLIPNANLLANVITLKTIGTKEESPPQT